MIVGRFAPSPSGDLHLGSLRTALCAWAFAKIQGGKIYYRVEDLDTGRARDEIIKRQFADLNELGLPFDDYQGAPYVRQSQRTKLYQKALETLNASKRSFWCQCSRKTLGELRTKHNLAEGFYPGTCEKLGLAQGPKHALRYIPTNETFTFNDLVLGKQTQNPCDYPGPPIIKRTDGLFAYQLAVVVDDIEMGVNQVIRGTDILPQTGVQLSLFKSLGGTPPIYGHAPLILNYDRKKFSKSEGALDLRSIIKRGVTVERILGFYAHTLSLADTPTPINLKKFISIFNPKKNLTPRNSLRR